MTRIGFIGAGNMARSLIGGLLESGHPAANLAAADPDAHQRAALRALGVAVSADNNDAVAGMDATVLAVKPQVMNSVLRGLTALSPGQLLISIAAGVPIAGMQRVLGRNQPLVRCMPNTPALLRQGVTALVPSPEVDDRQRQLASAVLSAAGRIHWLHREADLDAVTAISGSGPAYFFYLLEAMISAGESLGLDRALAQSLACETALGAARMALVQGADPGTLRRNVTSPGGTTERALGVLDAASVSTTLIEAMRQAAQRSKELAEDFSKA